MPTEIPPQTKMEAIQQAEKRFWEELTDLRRTVDGLTGVTEHGILREASEKPESLTQYLIDLPGSFAAAANIVGEMRTNLEYGLIQLSEEQGEPPTEEAPDRSERPGASPRGAD